MSYNGKEKEVVSSKKDNDIAIEIKDISKCFHLYDRPINRLRQFFANKNKKYYREFWALKNINFSIKKGETVGILGRNGSGKSTLLQIICNTLSHTTGNVMTKGRVAALLELGAGFNPEFTGRENVYMSASIYGLSKKEIEQRFQKIEEFADIGEHIDQPVKSYSSGMYVRLAFSVIAHVDADILIVDEALSVGDAIFTQKCMRFIREFRKKGTLLFVSHDMSSILNLCEKAIWLNKGEMRSIGNAKDVCDQYLQFTLQETYGENIKLTKNSKETSEINSIVDYESQYEITNNLNEANGWKSGFGEIVDVTISNLGTGNHTLFKGWEKVIISIKAKAIKDIEKPAIGFIVKDRLGQDLFGENSLPFASKGLPNIARSGSTIEAEFTFILPMLPNGQYVGMVSLGSGTLEDNIQHHLLHDAFIINISSSLVRWGLVGVPFDDIYLGIK